MSCDTVPSEILLESFKRLECKERVRARIVCKEWLNIIDENRSLWRSLDFDIDMDDKAKPEALILFDKKSQSTLKDVSIHMTNVTNSLLLYERNILNRLFDTLGKSNKTLQSAILKAEFTHQVKTRASEVLMNCPNLDTFMFFDPRFFHSNVITLQKKVYHKKPSFERSKLQVLWTSLASDSVMTRPSLLENLVSLAVSWDLPASKWREVLLASARSLKHLQIPISKSKEPQLTIPTLSFPNLEVFEGKCDDDKFPEWMIFPSTTILILRDCDIKENLPPVNELWVSWLLKGLNLGKCCPLLVELRISCKDLAMEYHKRAILALLHKRKKQVAIGFEVAGVRMVPLKRIILPFENCQSGLIDEVMELVEEVVDLAEVPNNIPLYI